VGATGLAAAAKPALVAASQRGGSPLYAIDDYVAKMDAGLARIEEWSISTAIPDFQGDTTEIDDLGRKAFKSIYMTAMFSDLPIEEQVHPEVQDRMWAIQPTVDEALDEMTAFLRNQSVGELARVQRTIQTDPLSIQRVVDFLDLEGTRTGISDQRRHQTRTVLEQAGWRLGNQPPSLLVNEYLDKVEKIDASDIESEARQRWMASKVGERVFWTVEQERSRREERISKGLHRMGIGALVLAGSALLLALTGDTDDAGGVIILGLIGATVGSVLILIGLVTLLIGAATAETAP
jgi:hypothetical protein